MDDTTRTLIFSSEKAHGALPVTDEHGQVLARITAPWSGGRFTVTGPDGQPLCLASARWWGLGAWQVTDADGNRLLSMTTNLLRNRAVIHLDRDGNLTVQGDGWGRGFTVGDARGDCVVRTGSEKAAAGAPHPDDVVLVQIPGVLDIAEVIAVAQIWRAAKKAAIVSSTAASSTVARGM